MRCRTAGAWLLSLVAGSGLLAACGTEATGISLTIEPDPVQATRLGDGHYDAEWDAVVADLTGVGGTVESIDFAVMGATVVTSSGLSSPPGEPLASASVAVAPFARRMFRERATFSAAAGQPVSVQVRLRFRDESGLTYDETAQARVTLR